MPSRAERGDFQTPDELAVLVCELLARRGVRPASILEPTCGAGSLLLAALDAFPRARAAVGFDIDEGHVRRAARSLRSRHPERAARVASGDFFQIDWSDVLASLDDPLLVIGNPPWITNSALGEFGGSNLPAKSNSQGLRGIDAITGKANFDISEWMLLRAMEWLEGRAGVLAVLCKTAVARKVLLQAWRCRARTSGADIHRLDAARWFGASVDACLLVLETSAGGAASGGCRVHATLSEDDAPRLLGFEDDRLIADLDLYRRRKHLAGEGCARWRSGIKHDCSKVMELRREGAGLRNGLGEPVSIEPDHLYPMLKGSQVAREARPRPGRWMLVPQRAVGDDTERIRSRAPRTWRYLQRHARLLDARASSIYRGRPRFSVFGVGDYAFAPWKVATSGLHKRLSFAVVGPAGARPVVLDDTCYFIACEDEREALALHTLLESEPAREFYSAFVFWDSKRPITVELLRRLDLGAVAREAGRPAG